MGLILSFLLVLMPLQDRAGTILSFWNLENMFDWRDDGKGASDAEFSTKGARRWTSRRFYAKCNAVAKTILLMGEEYGHLPDAVGFAEVENAFVVRQICSSTILRKLGYRTVHYESPDPRGIDCALIYRPSSLQLVGSRPCHTDTLATRDILLCQFVTSGGDSLAVTVNHHPSKYGGDGSGDRRAVAVRVLCGICDSLTAAGWRCHIAMGDFNEGPENGVYDALKERMTCLSIPLLSPSSGTIKFNGDWDLIDQAYASPRLDAVQYIFSHPVLLEKDKAHSGFKPRRTYIGPRYNGGVSDHLPIVIVKK